MCHGHMTPQEEIRKDCTVVLLVRRDADARVRVHGHGEAADRGEDGGLKGELWELPVRAVAAR